MSDVQISQPENTAAAWLRFVLSAVLLGALALLPSFGIPDYAQDYAAAWGWWHARDPHSQTATLLAACCGTMAQSYPDMQTAHPPFATLLALPFALLPWNLARQLWCLVGWAAVVGAWQRGRVAPAVCAATLSFWIIALVLGTHEPLIFVLLMFAMQDRAPTWAGILIGLCAAIKIYPALLIVGLWLTGRRRQALAAVVAGVLAALAAEVVLGFGVTASWLAFLPVNTARYVDSASNGSLVRLLRAIVPGLSPLVASALVAALLTLPLLPRLRQTQRVWPMVPVMLLASPLSWRHYAGLMALGPVGRIEQVCLAVAGGVALLAGLELIPADNLAPLAMGPLLLALLLRWYQAARPVRRRGAQHSGKRPAEG